MTRVLGVLKSSRTLVGNVIDSPTVKTFEVVAVAVPVTISFVALIAAIFSGTPILNYLFYLLVLIAQILGLKKTPKPWGTVYDSITKRPIPFARVEILNDQKRKLQSVIADADGRYGFILSSQRDVASPVAFQAFRTEYDFPSKIKPSEVEHELYPNIYQGGSVNLASGLTNFDLPMDPRSKSSNRGFYFGIVSIKFNNIITKIADVLFVFGTILGLTNFIVNPNINNLSMLAIILSAFVVRKSGFKLKPFGLTKDKEINQILPFSLITLHNQGGERVSFTVSDAEGRYFLLTPKGKFILKAFTPAHILPTRTEEIPVLTTKGWISREIGI